MAETCKDCANKCIMYEPNMKGCRNRMVEYFNIIEVLESIKEACGKRSTCKDCPFSATYRHKGDCIDIYYCKIAEMPNGWQIDSVQDAEVLCDVTVFAKYYNGEV